MEDDDDRASETSEITSVYSASSDTPGGEPSVALMFKFHASASNSIQDHLLVHGSRDFVIDYKQLSETSAKVTVPQSASQGMIYNLNGSKVNGQYKLTVEMYRERPKKHEVKERSDARRGSSNEETCTLYVGSKLPEYTNEQHLRDHFRAFASSITKIDLIRDRNTKQFKGFAFITFTSKEIAQAAMKVHNHSNLLGMRIQVNFDQRKGATEQAVSGIPLAKSDTSMDDFSDSESVASESVYSDLVKVMVHTRPKIPTSVKNSALMNHFKNFKSDIGRAFVCRHRKTKESRGFALVFFKSSKAAEYAIEKMRGTKLMGQYEIISISISKEKIINTSTSSASPIKLQQSPNRDDSSFRYPNSSEASPENISGAVARLSLSDQPPQRNPQTSVIIENLGPEFDESTIQSIVKAPMLSCKRLANLPGAVVIKFHYESDAVSVVRELNNTVMLGRSICARMAPPAGPMLSNPSAGPLLSNPSTGPLVSNPSTGPLLSNPSTGPLLSNPSTGRLLSNPLTGPLSVAPPVPGHSEYQHSISMASSQPYSTVSSMAGAQPPQFQRGISTVSVDSDVVPSSLQAGACSVKVTHIARGVTKEQLYLHFKSAGEIVNQPIVFDVKKSQFMYAYVNYHDALSAQRAVTLLNKSSINGVDITVKLSTGKAPLPQEEIPDDKYESVLQLNPHQWNDLMHVNPTTGSKLFNEIMDPFKLNRDVDYNPDYDNNCIMFSGRRETVDNARDYLLKHLNKEISMERHKMEALCHLKPNLPFEMSQYSVQITGFEPSSSTIKFDGQPSAIERVRALLNQYLLSLCCENISLTREYRLTELENMKQAIAKGAYGSKVFICISPDFQLTRVLPVWSLDKNTLKAVVPLIMQSLSVSNIKLECSSAEAFYIKQFCHSIVTQLSLKVEFREDSVFLKGRPEEVERAKTVFRTSVLYDLCSKKYPFSCKLKFKDMIEQSLLQPYTAEEVSFKYLAVKVNKEKSRKKYNEAKQETANSFDVYVFSTNKEFFDKVCIVLDSVSPSSKPYPITQDGMEKVLMEMKVHLENKYHVKISQGGKQSTSFIIDALIPAELRSCMDEIREKVEQTVVTVKYVNISDSLCLLLKLYQDDINERKKKCEINILQSGGGRENCAIRLKGTISQVNDVLASLSDLIELTVFEDSCVLNCPTFLFGMWLRRWNQVREQEAKKKTYVNYSKQEADKDSNSYLVKFRIVGSDQVYVSEVKEAILSEGVDTEEKVFSLTPAGIACLLSARKEKKLGEIIKDIVYVKQIDKQHNKVTLIAPKELSENLEAAEELVRKFVGERASTSYVLCSKDPVVNLILSNQVKSMEYITRANSVSREHHVSVIIQKKPVGLRLSGTEGGLSIVKPLIQSLVLDSLERSIGEIKVPVKPIYIPLLKSPDFMQFESKLGSDLCVSCSYPRPGRSSKLIGSSQLTTDMPGQVIQVDICKGDLVYEQVDCIVNAANEDLKHIGGLAKAICDAGGPSIQRESDEYIATHKKVQNGSAVILGSGDLPCKKIVHAVGPRWQGGMKNEEQNLYFTVFKSLEVASSEQITSIAFPAISTGVFGVPEEVCARMSLKAVRDFFQSQSQTTITHIKFVLYNQSAVNAFLSVMRSGLCGAYKPHKKDGIISTLHADAMISSPLSASSWEWMNDQGGFSPYSAAQCSQLDAAFKSNPMGQVSMVINGNNNYVIDFSRMLQINTQTRGGRNIRQTSQVSPLGSSSIQWEYFDRQFLPYSSQDSALIEKMYQDKVSGQLVINGTTYNIDPVQMTQTNSVTNYRRNIKRQTSAAPQPSAAPVSQVIVSPVAQVPAPVNEGRDDNGSSNDGVGADDDLLQSDIVITLRGPHDSLHTAKDRLTTKLNKSIYKLCFDKFPKGIVPPDLEKKLHNIAKKNSVTSHFEDSRTADGKSQRILHLKGVHFKCKAALEAIQEEMLTFHMLSVPSDEDVELPPEWQQQSKTTELFTLIPNSSEWSRVHSKFSSTMSGHQVVSISRIQNKWLWEKYIGHKKRLDRKNSGRVNEMELFHGTRGNDPRNIYEGEEGFDMRFSAQGMWGMANYFAVKASYSNNYSYRSSTGRQMFLVKVLTGDTHECPSNNSLRMPPLKGNSTGSGEVQLTQARFDTVSGFTNGSQVFMTYDNDKAYPAYLITYQ